MDPLTATAKIDNTKVKADKDGNLVMSLALRIPLRSSKLIESVKDFASLQTGAVTVTFEPSQTELDL
ncbi:MAG: hypothetical protein U5R06_02390 [candidate division KSB1 bacterium]|nr:hypothetical protein [candidate division KSB1 bacterium]